MRFDLLTPREKECLRLLLYPKRPKDIALATNLSVHTVNGHLKSARRKLGASDSLSAAQMLREYETPSKVGGINISGSPSLADPVQQDEAETKTVTDGIRIAIGTPFGTKGRPWNDLSFKKRMFLPIILLGFIALAAGALVSGAASLSLLLLSLAH